MAAFWAVNATAACGPLNRSGPARQELSWTSYLGSPGHDAAATELLNPDPRPLWATDVGRAVRGSPALGETVVAVGVAERQVVLLDRASGAPIWRRRTDGTILAGPLLDGDRLYLGTERSPQGRVHALRLRDGRRLWSRTIGGIAAPLALEPDAVYAATETGLVVRLDPDKGTIVWRRALSGGVRAAPVPTAAGLLVATTADTLFLLSREHGMVQRRLATPGAVVATPAVSDQRVFLGSTEGHVLEVALPELEIRWSRSVEDDIYGAPALAGDTVYALTRGGVLWMIPSDAPEQARAHALDIVARAGPTPTASGVLVASVAGEVLLVDPTTGHIRWRARVDPPIEQPPLVLERQLIVVGGRGTVHAFR